MANRRTAIVTGAGKRVGADDRARRCSTDGWTVVAHVHHDDDAVPDGAIKVVADLADADCAEAHFRRGRGPAARAVAGQQRRALRMGRLRRVQRRRVRCAHGGQRARAGTADRALRRAITRRRRMRSIVNLLDAKLAAPNPDYLSYTLSKQALAGFTELAARALAPRGHPGQRHRAGADAAIERPERGEFRGDAREQSARRGVEPDDVVGAIRYLIEARCVTGQVLVDRFRAAIHRPRARRPIPGGRND